jgi:hypothetical protein
MKCCVDEYNLLKKNKGRESSAQNAREDRFKEELSQLFDIAHKDAEQKLKIEEDRIFLRDQRGPRKMRIAGVDKISAKKEERSRERKEKEDDRRSREKERKVRKASVSRWTASGSESEDSKEGECDIDNDYEIEIPLYYKKQLHDSSVTDKELTKRPGILQTMLSSPDVTSTLDRINLSDRKFTLLAAAIARANDEDVDKGSLSTATVRRKRSAHREIIQSELKEEVRCRCIQPLVVHWDGKLLEDTTDIHNPKKVDRLAVVVTGLSLEKILGIAKLPSGTGEAQTNATIQLLRLWQLEGDIIGMCFDTTSTNTGVIKGTCKLMQDQLDRNLLHFACRHHMHELIIGAVFNALFGSSVSPNISLFERFKGWWSNIDQKVYRPLEDTRLEEPFILDLKHLNVSFLRETLSTNSSYLPREDYRELIELCLLVLGISVHEQPYRFRAPGAYHMARWMAKVIYSFKIYLFRDQFKLTPKEAKNLTEFCLFASHIYVAAWISCPVTRDAPVNDLLLFRQISQYAVINKVVSDAARGKLERHLWYIGPELISLALFSNKVSSDQKRSIVSAMCQAGEDWSVRGIKLEDCTDLETKELSQFVTASTTSALRSLSVDMSFLNADPDAWNDCPAFLQAKSVVDAIKVVNDAAERSVALMSSFNKSITRNEVEMQRLLQAVEDNRKRIPNSKKSVLKGYKMRTSHAQ